MYSPAFILSLKAEVFSKGEYKLSLPSIALASDGGNLNHVTLGSEVTPESDSDPNFAKATLGEQARMTEKRDCFVVSTPRKDKQ